MASNPRPLLGLIVNAPPYRSRVARDGVDFALAAAAMEFDLRIYFPGAAILQLVVARDPSAAKLPGGYRAWAALPDLTDTRVFAQRRWEKFCRAGGLQLALPVEALDAGRMKQSWRHCDHVVVL
jgi:sulfur relay (sulfurtransferase) DsrF/TusC family protein